MKRYFDNPTEPLKQIFESDLNGPRGMVSCDADRIEGIVGSEGSGKSNFALLYLELWYLFLQKALSVDSIKNVCANEEEFAEALAFVKKLDLLVLDEAVLQSYSRTGMSAGNVNTNKFLMTCRGLNLKILVLIPNILDMDAYLRKTRISALWVVLPRHRVAYFSRTRLRQLLPRLAEMSRRGNYPDAMKCGVSPNFTTTFPKYTGLLAAPYAEKKKQGMEKVKKMLMESLKKSGKVKGEKKILTDTQQKVLYLMQQGFQRKIVASILGTTGSNVSQICRVLRQKGYKPQGLENSAPENIELARKVIITGEYKFRDEV